MKFTPINYASSCNAQNYKSNKMNVETAGSMGATSFQGRSGLSKMNVETAGSMGFLEKSNLTNDTFQYSKH